LRAAFDIMFVLVPGFSMIALYSALEPLRVANRFGGELFRWRFVSIDGEAVTASNGIPVSVEGSACSGRPAQPCCCVFEL
jgi:AraC family carnitine catabolism transcriptional activator